MMDDEDDDMLTTTLSASPATSPIARGLVLAAVVVSTTASGCLSPGETAPDANLPRSDSGPPPIDGGVHASCDCGETQRDVGIHVVPEDAASPDAERD